MICPKCGHDNGAEFNFCANCGYEISKQQESTTSEELPIILLIGFIKKKWKIFAICLVALQVAISGYIAYSKYKEKQEEKQQFEALVQKIANTLGTYKNSDISVTLNYDNTAYIEASYKTMKGYWREKADGAYIEIDLSDSEKFAVGSDYSYHSTIYLTGTRLWSSLSAMRSQDFSKSESLQKE